MLLPVRPIFLYYLIYYFLYCEVPGCFAQIMRNQELKQVDSNEMVPEFKPHKISPSINSKQVNSNINSMNNTLNNTQMVAFSANQGLIQGRKEVEPVTSFPLKDSCFSTPMVIILPEQTKKNCHEIKTTEFPFTRCAPVEETEPPKPAEFRNRMPMECIPNNFGPVCPCGVQTEVGVMKSVTTGRPKQEVYSCKWEGKLIQAPEILTNN